MSMKPDFVLVLIKSSMSLSFTTKNKARWRKQGYQDQESCKELHSRAARRRCPV
ncbi:hypothetical protein GALMADRAFT_242425 [Galerina marginata CBS 339.88]|uniref:Uncharacterized protein n=1 Tax=Galerina marginata (strain CBS 339.88) TaxID=685588 RepID=A0A067TMH1_GALM3|nr:hypothetical protein GALMADRAFT_242425 [Galerina marginata CBS 339.88]